MSGEAIPNRVILDVTGADALSFLQGLVSNDVLPLAKGPGLVWAALLTAQGKYLADFFVAALPQGGMILDLPASLAAGVQRRLAMYRLRADVQFAPSALLPTRGLGQTPAGAMPDPRHPALGWRAYGPEAGGPEVIDWTAIRVEHLIPETGIELIPDDTYLLEAGFDRLHGVDFRKGCYVGQEVTARMKHKTELRKGLVRVRIDGSVPVGTPILAEGKPAGTLFSQSGGRAIAYLRFDRTGPLMAGSAEIHVEGAVV